MNLSTPEGRRGAAFLALVGGAIIMTGFAGFGVYQLRHSAGFTFWLALAAHGQVLVSLTALGALLVKRGIKVSRDSIEINDQGDAAQSVADAAQTQANEVKQ